MELRPVADEGRRRELSSDRWQAVSPYLDQPLDLAPDERDDWMRSLRAANPTVAADVTLLLREHDELREQGFLEETLAPDVSAAGPEVEGQSIGPFKLVKRLGEGGMGTVWLAQQDRPIRRRVALKAIKPGRGSRDVLSRFEAERQALAILNHQHVAKVFDAGETGDGRPYFVMEYVDGVPITTFADHHALTVRDRLALFLQVCDAVQHTHQNGVLHRDLKPGNILVAEEQGQPLTKVIDFGIAKAAGQHLAGETLHTEAGVLLGTPEYMSPEQAGLVDAAVDARTDIYSLGLLLYELLTGRPPFDGSELRRKPLIEALRVIREEDPPRLTARLKADGETEAALVARLRQTEPRVLLRELRGELEWITSRAIEKEPVHRYGSVSELRADVRRYLNGDPVLAGAPSTIYRLRKLARRHRAAAVAIVSVALMATALISTLSLVRALRAEDRTRRQLIGSLVSQGMQRVDDSDPLRGLRYFTRALEMETDPARIRGHRIRIGETLQRAPRLVRIWRHEAPIVLLARSSRDLVATGSVDGVIRIRELLSDRQAVPDLDQGDVILGGEFSPDGALLAVASEGGSVRIWDPASGRLVGKLGHQTPAADLEFSPDGQLIAAIHEDGSVRVWNCSTGSLLFEHRHEGGGRRALFAASGRTLATGGADGVRLWRLPAGEPSGVVRHRNLEDMVLTADDRWLATASRDSTARLWDLRTGQQLGATMRHDAGVINIAFSPGLDLLVTSALDHTTRMWRVPDGTPARPPSRSNSIPLEIDVSTLMIASATQGGAVDLWPTAGGQAALRIPHAGTARIRHDTTGRYLPTGASDGIARIWDLAPVVGTPDLFVTEVPEFTWRVVSSPGGDSVAVSSGPNVDRGTVRLLHPVTGGPVTPVIRLAGLNPGIAFSPDGRLLATAAASSRLWDAATGEPVAPLAVERGGADSVSFSPDGRRFIVASQAAGAARLRDTTDPSTTTDLALGEPVSDASFAPDGRRLVTATLAGGPNIKMWDADTGRLLWTAAHSDAVLVAKWNPDGSTVITGGADHWLRSWHSSSGAPASLAVSMLGVVSALDLTGDGQRLIAGTVGGDLRLADVPNGRLLSVMSHRGFVYQSRFSGDGSLAITSTGDRTARLWDGLTGEPLSPALPAGDISRGATFVGSDAWAWTGVGLQVDTLSIDNRPASRLRALAEGTAGRALTDAGTEVVLPAGEIEARLSRRTGSSPDPPPPSADGYHRAQALAALRRGRLPDAVRHFERLPER